MVSTGLWLFSVKFQKERTRALVQNKRKKRGKEIILLNFPNLRKSISKKSVNSKLKTLFDVYLFLKEREREREQGRGRERGRHRT